MYTRFIVQVFGDDFIPSNIINHLDTCLSVCDYCDCDKHDDSPGILFLQSKNQFSNEYPDNDYENQFVDFYKKNFKILKDAGADDFRIMMDIYYADQCNFEIFNKKSLSILAKYGVSLPISVYYVGSDRGK